MQARQGELLAEQQASMRHKRRQEESGKHDPSHPQAPALVLRAPDRAKAAKPGLDALIPRAYGAIVNRQPFNSKSAGLAVGEQY